MKKSKDFTNLFFEMVGCANCKKNWTTAISFNGIKFPCLKHQRALGKFPSVQYSIDLG
jgi:hypothetical protein